MPNTHFGGQRAATVALADIRRPLVIARCRKGTARRIPRSSRQDRRGGDGSVDCEPGRAGERLATRFAAAVRPSVVERAAEHQRNGLV